MFSISLQEAADFDDAHLLSPCASIRSSFSGASFVL